MSTRSSARLQQQRENNSSKVPPDISGATKTTKATTAAKPARTTTGAKIAKPTTTKPKDNPPKKQKVAVSGGAASKESRNAKLEPNPAWAKVKGKRGKLRLVVEMPFDILLEIFVHLEPGDLLALSRANKDLRVLLLNRSIALPLWTSAFESVKPAPPKCPEDLTLPQYANLLYGRRCMFCDGAQSLRVSWICYLRVCTYCLDKQTKFVQSNFKAYTREVYSVVPYFSFRKDRFYILVYSREACERKSKELARLTDQPKAQLEYIKQEKKKIAGRGKRLGGFLDWESTIATAKYKDTVTGHNVRVEALLERLAALGYADDLARLSRDAIETLPGFKGSNPLTEKGWEVLKPKLIEVLEEVKNIWYQEKMSEAVSSRSHNLLLVYEYFLSNHRDLEPTAPPHGQLLAKLEPFKTLIYNTPPSQDVTQADMLAHLDQIPEIVKNWSENVINILLSLLPQEQEAGRKTKGGKGTSKKGKGPVPDPAVLERATTIFGCNRCPPSQSELLLFPHVVSHECLNYRHGKVPEEEQWDPNCWWIECHDSQLEFDEAASECASAIINALGKDPKTTTWKELDEDNQRVECLTCRKNKRLVMDWRHAILHELAKHLDEDDDTRENRWQMLDSESLAQAYKLESPNRRPAPERLCVECRRHTIVEKDQQQSVQSPSLYGNYRERLGKNVKKCPSGHDLSKTGVYYRYPEEFKTAPNAVKI
ncbi:hypothetical protein EST38_g3050 [Candolleomyces aberdarensis]|uniref:F-box domain-containing protein n=1 Tax=Candolleomyces aberdarensis TaxID=2316362 RepID=A0A4Q2DQZ4_9AGAR|nr:hypothetical protein EST38_g3050 [Candolleomyces aberdarensis]